MICFKYGEALYPEYRLFADKTGDQKIPMSFCFYLIETEDKKILVDTGCELFEHYHMYVYEKPLDLLKQYGLAPEDITDVLITHCHMDHISCIDAFQHAQIYIQKDEFARAGEYLSSDASCHVFEQSIQVCEGVRMEMVGGHTKGSCVVFAGTYILCGDEAYYYRNFEEKICIGNCYSKETAQAFVEHYCDGDYKPLLFHDSGIMPNRVGFREIN